jgi:hypothetical protein
LIKTPVQLLAVLGLLLWTAITATTIYLPSGSISVGVGNPLQNLVHWWTCLYPGFCSGNPTGNSSHAVVQYASPWFIPAAIILLSSLANGMWLLLGHTVLGVHRRIEIDDSFYVMAVLVFIPPILPVAVLFKNLFRSRPADHSRILEA